MKLFSFALILLLPALALAAEGENHHGPVVLDDATLKTIIYQCINVGALVIGLIYFLKTPVRQYFTEKKQSFMAAAEKAQAARKAAEYEHMQIKVQLTKLESTADETMSRARAEAADLRHQMMAEAEEMSKRIRHEGEITARVEVERAKAVLREQMIREAIHMAEQSMKEKVSREDHQRLQGDFISNIGTVQS